ncbi:hypothetical protein EMCRGX_G025430 [Ephydatia muelleri]
MDVIARPSLTMPGLWAPFKELACVITAAIGQKRPEMFYVLDSVLKKHKPDFFSLLQNPARNPAQRTALQKAPTDGITISSLPNVHILPQDFVDEALILSDILDLNEMSAAELLLAGEQQLPRFPGLTRGLVAVLLYHDGRRNLVSSLRSLIQAREGVSWTLELSPTVASLVMSFTDQLFEDNLVAKILNLLSSISVDRELDKLDRGRAIGKTWHRQQLVSMIEEQRLCLAECLFYWACQNPFPKDAIMAIIEYLKGIKKPDEKKPLDPVTLALFFSLVASFSVGSDVAAEAMGNEHYPLVKDHTLLPTVHNELQKDSEWGCPQMLAALKFAWGVLLRECTFTAESDGLSQLEEDEAFVDQALLGGALPFLQVCVVGSKSFYSEEYYVRRTHWLVTSFISNMSQKVRELRSQADEIARETLVRMSEGEAPLMNERRDFEDLMRLVGDMYSSDPHQLNLLSEFWNHPDSQYRRLQRAPQRQVSLFKFITICSSLLPAPLFASFMHMLCGLSNSPETAHHCFNFLKANSPSLGGGGPSAAISLDHFFWSLQTYYLGLRKDGGVRQTATGCAISPLELEGLRAVLKLIRTMATQSEGARVVMYENQTWLPVASLFGLLGCAIPRILKADILLTLAAFAISPEIAGSMWLTVEISQILNTVPSSLALHGGPSSKQEGSIQVELEEIESKAEEYPLTRAFLTLIEKLVSVPIPGNLGTGHRVPGFQPYLEFLRDSVFLKFDTRAYSDPNEKWQVATLVLEIFYKLLASHVISDEDFVVRTYPFSTPGVPPGVLPGAPGYTLFVHMMTQSPLLKKLLAILDEGVATMSAIFEPRAITEKIELTRATLCTLKLLLSTLAKEEEFLEHLRQSSQSQSCMVASSLTELLQGINPRTEKEDHLVNVARCVALSRFTPELSLEAVRILYWVCHSPKASRDLVTTILGDKDVSMEILQGFVEHLEWEEFDSVPVTEVQEDGFSSVGQVHCAVQLDILKLLASSINMSIAHFLLGFDVRSRKQTKETTLQDPAATPCISKTTTTSFPKLAELCYHVLHLMCCHPDLSTSTLRYLRNNHDFFHVQLSHLPVAPPLDTHGEWPVSLLHQQAELLQMVAVEMRVTSLTQLRSHSQRLLALVLDEGVVGGEQGALRKVLRLLEAVDFGCPPPAPLRVVEFDQKALERTVESCEVVEYWTGFRYTDVRGLRAVLMEELNSFSGTPTAAQRQSLIEEIHSILETVVERNRCLEVAHAHSTLFKAWRQLVEVTLITLGQDLMPLEHKVLILFEILQELLLKVERNQSSDLVGSVHGTVLMLISHLKATVSLATGQQSDPVLTVLYSGPLHAILKGLAESILLSSSSSSLPGVQRVRAYLYGSLLSFLHLTSERPAHNRAAGSLWEPHSREGLLRDESFSLLNSFGEPLMETVCRDACNGQEVCRMLSLALLDAIVTFDREGRWLRFMVAKGYLQKLCASVQWEDEALQRMLLPSPEPLKALYVYESKMAFLTRVAQSSLGCRELVNLNVLVHFNECRFIDQRPEAPPLPLHSQPTSFVPSVMSRYHQLLVPLFKFLSALVSTPGPSQRDATTQVFQLLAQHSEVLSRVLKGQQGSMLDLTALNELQLVTAVIGKCGVGHDWTNQMSSLAGGLMRIHRLMVSLLPYYCSHATWKQLVGMVTAEENKDSVSSEEVFIVAQKVCCNVVDYARAAMTTGGGPDHSATISCVLLTPDLTEAIFPARSTSGGDTSSNLSRPSLGLLVRHIRECTEGYLATFESYQAQNKKVGAPGAMSAEELRQLLPDSGVGISTTQQQLVARKTLETLVQHKKLQLELYIYIIENCLYILWKHLSFYLEQCKPGDLEPDIVLPGLTSRPAMRRLQGVNETSLSATTGQRLGSAELSEGVRLADIERLKTNATKCLTETFFKTILDAEEAHQASNTGLKISFIEAQVRRLRRLLKLKATQPQLHVS